MKGLHVEVYRQDHGYKKARKYQDAWIMRHSRLTERLDSSYCGANQSKWWSLSSSFVQKFDLLLIATEMKVCLRDYPIGAFVEQ
ncbi:MAG: hypothetical protein SPD11_10455 [Sphaerochaetaceae bacterium]|nr:hypothetical protein [Sphaerochaetaceae bacterium]